MNGMFRNQLLTAAAFCAVFAGCHLVRAPVPPQITLHNAKSEFRGQSPEAGLPEQQQQQQRETAPAARVFLPITLREAVEAALSDSSVVRVLNGRVNPATVGVWDTMIADQEILVEKGRFQPRLSTVLEGSQVDQPPNAFFGPGIAANTRRDATDASARITQPLSTGGSVSLGIEPPLAYLYLPEGVNPGQFNPAYSTDYVLRVNQPLLRGRGSDVALAPIQIAQIRANQSRWELEEQLNAQVRSVSEAYWQLYAASIELEAIRGVVPLAEESVRIEQLRLQAERTIFADLARAQYQLEGFRRSESVASGEVRRRVLQLRQLMGGHAAVDPLLLPAEQPSRSAPTQDSGMLVSSAVANRPLLNEQRERIQERAVRLNVAQNRVFPQLDLRGQYRSSGLTERLDASFDQAATFDYTDWTVGVTLDMSLGNQTARSQRRIAELELLRDQIRLSNLEQNVAFEIAELQSDLQTQWERFQLSQKQAQETQEWLRISRIRYSQPPASSSGRDWLLLELTDFQAAMRSYIDAVSGAGSAIADYNTLLARLDQAQGISMYKWRTSADEEVADGQWMLGGYSMAPYQSYRGGGTLPPGAIVPLRQDAVPGGGGAQNRGHSFPERGFAAEESRE